MKHEQIPEPSVPERSGTAIGNKRAKGLLYAKRLAREPFFHFIFLGAILFGFGKYIQDKKRDAQQQIVLTTDQIIKLAENYEKVYGSIPAKAELKALINNAIKEEVLYREGVKQGLDQNDEIIKRRVVQKFEFLEEDLATVPEPDDKQLQSFVNKNEEKYRTPPRLSFTHIFFSPDVAGDKQAEEKAKQVLLTLNSKQVANTSQLGDRFPFLYNYSGVSKNDIEQIMGVSPLSNSIFSLAENKWIGPFKSGYGWHLVYVSKKDAAALPPLSKIRDQVRDEYVRELHDRKNEEQFNKLKAKYTIIQDDVFKEASAETDTKKAQPLKSSLVLNNNADEKKN